MKKILLFGWFFMWIYNRLTRYDALYPAARDRVRLLKTNGLSPADLYNPLSLKRFFFGSPKHNALLQDEYYYGTLSRPVTASRSIRFVRGTKEGSKTSKLAFILRYKDHVECITWSGSTYKIVKLAAEESYTTSLEEHYAPLKVITA